MDDVARQANEIVAKANAIRDVELRRQYVDRETEENIALKEEVRRLLDAEEFATGEVEQQETQAFSSDTKPTTRHQLKADQEIGAYRIIQKLGEGGFGEVYRARQSAPVRRDVALKLLKRGMDSDQVLARFEAERQALAMMDHPCIAKVFDAGTTDSGQPFFVMELVRGVPITRYADLHRLSIIDRVQLVIAACQAIQHAHHKGVIHRDIKPSNILVVEGDDRPKPVVIDFGVAKATQQSLSDQSVVTHFQQLIGTPAYMSPEQAEMSGLDVDTRADVYSLGVVLFELLCGTVPHAKVKTGRASTLEIARILREEDAGRPSQSLPKSADEAQIVAKLRRETVPSLKKQLQTDLDWIALKCLEKDRKNRYETASGLALDLGRYLDNEPVRARRPSVAYTVSKFATRHRGPVIAAALIFASLAVGLAASLYLYATAERRAREVLQLSDLNQLLKLQDAMDDLFTVAPDKRRTAMDDWLERAQTPMSRLNSHHQTLERLIARGERASTGEDHDELSDKVVFKSQEEQWQFDNQLALVKALDDLVEPGGWNNQVLNWSERMPSGEEIERAWEQFLSDFEPSHPDLKIVRRPGLFPTGRNPTSGLWEFCDLNTGLPADTKSEGFPAPDVHTGLQYVLVLGGRFQMGSPETEERRKGDEPLHTVSVSPFLVSKHEVTQTQWERIMGFVQKTEFRGALRPVGVSWFDAMNFCGKVGAALPTEAQWEFACRAGTTGPYAGTGNIEEMGWYEENSGKSLQNIGLKLPNQFGLFDMHGNAIEWAFDRWEADFYERPAALQANPVNPPLSLTHAEFIAQGAEELAVLRGGTCQGAPWYCRSADRFKEEKYVQTSAVGFRPCIRDVVVAQSR